MNSLQVFQFESKEVRFVGTAESPAWIGKDACFALSISKYRDAIADLAEDERMSVVVDTPGGKQTMTAVNEAGLYQLVLKAPTHVAKPFTRWLTHDVLPSIRKTGSYKIEPTNEPQQPAISPELEVAREIHEIYELAEKNPRIAQLLVDSRVNRFLGQAALPGTVEVWKGAVEIAEDLGYKTNHRNRGSLGKHVKALVGHLAQEEERLCNGTNRPISLYPDTEEVRDAVASFFEEEQQARSIPLAYPTPKFSDCLKPGTHQHTPR